MKKIKVGDVVRWNCKPFNGKAFIAEGIVRDIQYSTFASKRRANCLKIEPVGEYREVYRGRKTTTIAAYNAFCSAPKTN